LLDLIHELVHRHAREPVQCVFFARADGSRLQTHCSGVDELLAGNVRAAYTVHARPGRERYPMVVELRLPDGARTGAVLPVVLDGVLVGDVIVLAPEAALSPLVHRHLALLGGLGSTSMLVDLNVPLGAGDSLPVAERLAMFEVLVAARDLADFVLRLAAWLRATVVVQSAALQVLETSDARGVTLAVQPHHVISGPEPSDPVDGRCWLIPRASPADSDRLVVQPGVVPGAAVAGYLVAEVGERGPDVTRLALEGLRELLRHQLTIRHEFERSFAMGGQSLIVELETGRPGPRVMRQAAVLGLDLRRQHRPIALRPVSNEGDPEALATLVRTVLQERDREVRALVGTSEDDCVLVLAPDGAPTADQLRARVVEAGWQVCAGIGPAAGNPNEFGEAIRKARWAAQIARSSQPPRHVVDFADLGFYGLIWQQEWLDELQRFADKRLGRLLAHGEERTSSLLSTLAEVLRAPRLTDAAASLYIHHSTLRYRIGRIEELLQVSLDDPDDRFELDLALRVLRMRDAPDSPLGV
jgi:hypothetical protein